PTPLQSAPRRRMMGATGTPPERPYTAAGQERPGHGPAPHPVGRANANGSGTRTGRRGRTASRSDGGEPDAHRDAFPRPCADPGTPAAGPPRRAPCIATRRNLPQERAPRPVPHESASSPGPVPGRPRRSTMHTMKRWNIEILLSEETDGDTANTWADAGLHAEGGTDLHGRGMARKHPADPEAPEI